MKRCSVCKTSRESTEFHRNRTSKDGLQSRCKSCESVIHKRYNKGRKRSANQIAYTKKYNMQRYEENKERVDELKAEVGCTYCGEQDPICLDHHHIEPKDKSFAISQYGRSWEALLEEMKKCEVVCCNCHKKLHAGRILVRCDSVGGSNHKQKPLTGVARFRVVSRKLCGDIQLR